jgi:hypothetical protein
MSSASWNGYGFEGRRLEGDVGELVTTMAKVEKQAHGSFASAASVHRASVLRSTLDMLQNSFLPVGYPTSVRPEYMTYQIYDSLQALCSYLRGVLCVHAVLVGAGVGQESGNALGE